MKKLSLQSAGSLLRAGRVYAGIAMVAFISLGVMRGFQKEPAGSGSALESPTVTRIRSHLNEISLSITTYLQNHDAFTLDLVKEEGKALTDDLDRLVQELKKQGKMDEAQHLEKAHQGMREASVALLIVDQEVIAAANAAEAARRPIERAFVQRGARSQMRIELTKEIAERFVRMSDDAQQAHIRRAKTVNRFNEWREVLEKTLRQVPSGINPSRTSGARLALEIGLLFIGLMATWWTYRRLQREIAKPLKDILQCVEAASTGDVSRVPDHWSGDEVGQLSQAVGRLIAVLARSENLVYHLAALVESSGDAIISHTLEGKVLSWNKGAQRIYGYSVEEMKGQSIETLVDEAGKADMMERLQRIREGERIKPFETTHIARSGRPIRAFVRVAAIYDSTRQIIGASFIAQELSHTKSPHGKIAETSTH